jgi:hypothetical protein
MFFKAHNHTNQSVSYASLYPKDAIEKIQDGLVQAIAVLQHDFGQMSPSDEEANGEAIWILANLLRDIRQAKQVNIQIIANFSEALNEGRLS